MYAWAKAENKPAYTADEIDGLSDYISGEIQDTDTQYKLEQDTSDGHILKLYSKALGGEWAEAGSVEVPDDSYDDAELRTLITTTVAGLDVQDEAEAGKYVSAVEVENGKLKLTRANITDTAVAKNAAITAGTHTKITYDAKGLVTGGADLEASDIPTLAISKIDGLQTALDAKQETVAFNGAYDKNTNKAATMADVTSAVAGLTGAMHFAGVKTEVPANGASGYASGDVVIVDEVEYVYDGTTWHELGDESDHAVKGAIVNADIADNAAIAQSKIAGLGDALAALVKKSDADGANGYVAKVAGKGLSANDYTDAEKAKVASAVQGVKVGDTALTLAEGQIAVLGAMAGKSEVAETDLATALKAKIDAKADDADLAAIAKSGNVNDLVQTANEYIVFNCGSSTTVI